MSKENSTYPQGATPVILHAYFQPMDGCFWLINPSTGQSMQLPENVNLDEKGSDVWSPRKWVKK